MAVLDQLEPRAVFRWFEALSGIPRGSRNTKAVSDWCVGFARERGLPWRQDDANNVILTAPASPGREGDAPLILQGHLDMVCEKVPGNPIDMEREPIRLVTDGEFVRADGTTLGGDDGIAAAMALAVLDDPSISHPPLEVVLTTEEEIGMLGAAALDASSLRGRRMLNLDSEVEGVFTVSCAGGGAVYGDLPVRRDAVRGDSARDNSACGDSVQGDSARQDSARGTRLSVELRGLTGGHSGVEIHHGRANACNVMGRLLGDVMEVQERQGNLLRLVRIDGGLKDNAIPVSCTAEILVQGDSAAVREALHSAGEQLRQAFRATDPGMEFVVTEIGSETSGAGKPGMGGTQEETSGAIPPMDGVSTRRVIRLLTEAPQGVQAMSRHIPGLVQTSLNLGILTTDADAVHTVTSVRSSVAEEKQALIDTLLRQIGTLGGEARVEGDYPAWEYLDDSPIRRLCEEVFMEQYGHAPKIEAIHAGVECGLFCGKLPGLDCISLGPDLLDIHTPRERMRITSVARVWAFLLEVLRRA